MNSEDYGSRDRHLDEFFQAYREACSYGEPGPNFMPAVWQRIDARQTSSTLFRRVAKSFVTAAAALSLILALFLLRPSPQSSAFYNSTYVEALASDHLRQNALYFEPVHIETVSDDASQD
jgi:hypothetical protein